MFRLSQPQFINLHRVTLKITLPVLILLVLALAMPTATQDTPPSTEDRLSDVQVQRQPLQALYQIEVRANISGWTDSLHWQAGLAHATLGDLHAAAAHWQQANLQSTERLRRLGQVHIDLNQWGPAVDTLERLLTLDPANDWAHFQLGVLLAASDPSRAMQHLVAVPFGSRYEVVVGRAATAIVTDDVVLNAMRIGLLLLSEDVPYAAELAFQYAAVLAHPYPEALAYVGLAREQQGKDGSQAMESAVRLDPDAAPVQYLYGLYLRARDELEASRNALLIAATIEAANPAYYAELGEAHRLLAEYQAAEIALIRAADLSDQDEQYRGLLAVFYAREGYHLNEDSLAVARSLSDNLPPDPALRASFAWMLHSLGDSRQALIEAQNALALDGEHPEALYVQASILIDMGENEAAIPILERIAAMDTQFNETVRTLLNDLGAN